MEEQTKATNPTAAAAAADNRRCRSESDASNDDGRKKLANEGFSDNPQEQEQWVAQRRANKCSHGSKQKWS